MPVRMGSGVPASVVSGMFTPSGLTRSGFGRTVASARRLPLASKRISVGPVDEKPSSWSGVL